jgi:hypothetical protein
MILTEFKRRWSGMIDLIALELNVWMDDAISGILLDSAMVEVEVDQALMPILLTLPDSDRGN